MRHLEKSVNIVLLLLLAELFQVLGFTHFGKTHLMSRQWKTAFPMSNSSEAKGMVLYNFTSLVLNLCL